MLENAKDLNLGFKLTIVSIVGMFAVPLAQSALDSNALSLLQLSAWTLVYGFLFLLFLRVAELRLGPTRHLILLFLLDYVLVVGLFVSIWKEPVNHVFCLMYMPLIVAGSYYCYCRVRRLI